MNHMILAHAGGIDEMGVIVLPAVMGFGTWILTRRRNAAAATPKYAVAPETSSPGTRPSAPVAQPGWNRTSDNSTVWTRLG
jgi:hypothetical protein